MDWVRLAEMKEAYPVQVAEYAIANDIAHEPAFNWWVHKVIKRKERLINKVKSKYWRTTHKFGIEVPKNRSNKQMRLIELRGLVIGLEQ